MSYRFFVWIVAVALTGLAGAGCRTQQGLAKAPRESRGGRATPEREVESPKDAEKRIEAHARYAMGVLHELNEETDQAIEEYRKSIDLDPDNESLVIELSRKLLQQKRYAKAEELLTRATSRPNASANLFARLGVAYYFLGKTNQAVAANHTALKKNPRLMAAYQNLLQLYIQANQYDDAVKVLDRAAAQPQPGANYLIDVAELYNRYSRTGGEREKLGKQKMLELLNRAARVDSKDDATQQRLAETYVRYGEIPKAIQIYLKLLDQNPDPLSIRERLIGLYVRVNDKQGIAQQREAIAREYPDAQGYFLALGVRANTQRNYKEAAEYFAAALQVNPDLEPVYYELAGAQINSDQSREALVTLDNARAKFARNFTNEFFAGMAYTRMKDFTNAVDRFAAAVQLNPDFESTYYDLAAAQINSDQPREALAMLDKVRTKFSRSFQTETYAGMAYTKMKDFTNAISRFAEAETIARSSEADRLNHVFYFQFGAACERSHQFAEAEKHFQKALKLNPDFAEALNYLGYMWADRGEHLQEAREMIEKAVKLDPDNAAYIDSLGWVLFRLNQPKEALTHIQRAVELSTEPDATLYDHLGDIFASLNQPDKAREAWRKSLSLEPNETIRKKLEPKATQR
jgi:tetratricopeptide (TPR) repeat protein